MVTRRSYKTDESFLEKLSMGATGTHKVFENLEKQGHSPIELERGSKSFKIWKKIKIKRVRVPDILCIACARRLEARAKSSLEISMSHSISDPERGWDFGLNDEDYVALVACTRTGNEPIDWRADDLVQYIAVKDLRASRANHEAKEEIPKGAQEGFELRITWPAIIARAAGVVSEINERQIKYRRLADNKRITLRNLPHLKVLVRDGDVIEANQILAATVPVVKCFTCLKSATSDLYISRLTSPSLSERYAAAKALSFFSSEHVVEALTQKIDDDDENIYVRLEAAASLSRNECMQGWSFIRNSLKNEYLTNRLETVIILGEIKKQFSSQLLIDVLLDDQQHSEIRAGAAWALGELGNKIALPALIQSFATIDENIRIEAARSLAKLALFYTPEILKEFPASTEEKRPGIAWALTKAGQFSVKDLLNVLVDDDARQWSAYMVGSQNQQKYIQDIEQLKQQDPEVYFAVTVLWKIMSSWVYELEAY